MIRLPNALHAWSSPEFEAVLKREIEQLGGGQFPLQQCLKASSHALDGPLETMIISVADESGFIRAKVGVFFSGITTGCSCADDPTPVEPQSEYCEVDLSIDKATADSLVTLVSD